MILRRFGSPAAPVLGIVAALAVALLAFAASWSELHTDYPRWGDAVGVWHFGPAFAALPVAMVPAYNLARLFAPGSIPGIGLSARGRHRQVPVLIGAPWAIGAVAYLVGMAPVMLRALGAADLSAEQLPGIPAVLLHLGVAAGLGAVAGVLLSGLPSPVAPVVAALATFLLHWLTVSRVGPWTLTPVEEVIPIPLPVAFSLIRLAAVLIILTGIIAAAIALAGDSPILPRWAGIGAGLGGLLLAGVMGTLVALPAGGHLDFHCRDASGVEVCLAEGDEPAREGIEESIRIIEQRHGPLPPGLRLVDDLLLGNEPAPGPGAAIPLRREGEHPERNVLGDALSGYYACGEAGSTEQNRRFAQSLHAWLLAPFPDGGMTVILPDRNGGFGIDEGAGTEGPSTAASAEVADWSEDAVRAALAAHGEAIRGCRGDFAMLGVRP